MKKVLTLVAFAAMTAFVACGPDKDKLREDSIRKADSAAREQAKADSIAREQAKADSIANAAKEQARLDSLRADSTRKADSAAKAGKGGPKKPKTPTPKAGAGKG